MAIDVTSLNINGVHNATGLTTYKNVKKNNLE